MNIICVKLQNEGKRVGKERLYENKLLESINNNVYVIN